MKKKVTAVISSIASIVGLCLVTYAFINKPLNEILETEDLVILFSITLCCISTLLYIKWTSWGDGKEAEINKIETENALLRKQIEQKELKTKLEDVSKDNK